MRTSGAADPSLLVLASLAGGNKHGYAIMEDVETFAGIRLGPGTLYGAITRTEPSHGWNKKDGFGLSKQRTDGSPTRFPPKAADN